MEGRVFGKLMIICLDPVKTSKKGEKHWICQCSCGDSVSVYGYSLKSGSTKSCKRCSLYKDLSNYSGKRYGHLTILERDYNSPNPRYVKVFCKCDCGNNTSVALNHLRSGHTTSCGCYAEEVRNNQKKDRKFISVLGKTYGKWSVTSEYKENKVRRVMVRCGYCGSESSTTRSALEAGQTPVCKVCSKMAAAEQAREVAGQAGYKFLGFVGEYNGYHTKLRLSCEKHGEWITTSLSKLVHTGRGCPSCSVTGFKSSKPAELYIMRISGRSGDFTGYGITNVFSRRLENHKYNLKAIGYKIDSMLRFKFTEGSSAQRIESLLKQVFPRGETEATGFVTENTKASLEEDVIGFVKGYCDGYIRYSIE